MDNNYRLNIVNVHKQFDIKSNTKYGGINKKGTKNVLNGLNLNLKKGETLGIIGKNGCGKSTLLKIISGVMNADAGTIEKNGKVASILELGIGFDPELSGRDNIFVKGGLFGLPKNEIEKEIDNIISFSEIGEQIDFPLRTYSSGMIAKLAFSILILVKCDILVIDEVLSVGDSSFNSKCRLVFEKMKKDGCSIMITSHNNATLENLCDRVAWIDNGITKEVGDPASVCYHYDRYFIDSLDKVIEQANAGDVPSINRLGVMYRDGISVNVDRAVAVQYFKKASDLGSTDALVNIANIKLADGLKDEATEYYKQAADLGNTYALIKYNELTNESATIDEFKKEVIALANTGNVRIMKLLANMLYEGNVFAKDQKEAIVWLKKCAEKNNTDAQLMLGQCYRDGIGVDIDTYESIKWYEKAAETGSIKANIELATIYKKGAGIEVDISKSIEWYEKAAALGDAGAMYQLGIMYKDANNNMADLSKSEYWLKLYSIQSLIKYEIQYADIIKQGYVGEKQKLCLRWYQDAASKNSIGGINNIASIYRDGSMMPPDAKKAVELYKKTSSMGSQIGLYELAMAYLKGSGIERNLERAFEYMKKAADRGNAYAMVQLLYMYRDGIGTTKDLEKAKEVNERLIEQGSVTGKINKSEFNL